MKTVLIVLLVLWLLVSLLGLILEGLFWLTVIGLIALVVTAIWGWFKLKGAVNQSRT